MKISTIIRDLAQNGQFHRIEYNHYNMYYQILISEFYLYELSLKDLYKCNYMRIKICLIFHIPKASKNLLSAGYVRLMMPYLQVPHHVYLLYLSGTYRICSWHFCRSLTDILLSVTNLKKDKEHMLQVEGSERDIGCFWLQNRFLWQSFGFVMWIIFTIACMIFLLIDLADQVRSLGHRRPNTCSTSITLSLPLLIRAPK